jgi:hypothetical protein
VRRRSGTYQVEHSLGFDQAVLYHRVEGAEEVQWRSNLREISNQCDELTDCLLAQGDLVSGQNDDHGGAKTENCALCHIQPIK